MTITGEEILSMALPQLQEECRKAKLSTVGDENILRFRMLWCLGTGDDDPSNPKRPISSTKKDEENPKRRKVCRPSDHLICSITLELPTSPVIAEDSFIYERAAIEDYFHSKKDETTRSPMTSEPMGQRLLPAPQIKSLIETLIEDGVITGELAQKWTESVETTKTVKEKTKEAELGDTSAMLWVAQHYLKAKGSSGHGATKAFQWYERAHHAGSVRGTAAIGNILTQAPSFQKQGVVYLTLAASKGSDFAALMLAEAYASGKFGLDVDKKSARHYIDKSLHQSTVKHMSEKNQLRAQKLYEALNPSLKTKVVSV